MPNYCENELWIKGDLVFRRDFMEIAKTEKGVLDFNQFVPYPEEWSRKDKIWNEWWENSVGEEPEYAYGKYGYDWSISHWGSKWNALESQVNSNNRRTLYLFDTAWSPPKPLIVKMSEMFPDLNFKLKFWECGCAFKGVYVCEKGEILEDIESNYRGPRGG